MIGRPTVLFLGGGSDAVPIVARGIAMGCRAVVLDYAADCPARRLADEFILASCYDPTDALGALTFRPDAVLCAGVDAPHVAAAIAERYDLPGISTETALLSKDKAAQYKALKAAGIAVPGNPGHGWWVIKPADSRGARGVFRVLPSEDVKRCVEEAEKISPTGRAFVQAWVEGIQLSTESIIQDGKVLFTAIAERNYSRLEEFAPCVIEDGSDMPATECGDPDTGGMDWKIDWTIQEAAKAIGMTAGILKGDIVWDGSKPVVIEVAARLSGGGFCSLMTPEVWGVDMAGIAIRQALGETIRPQDIHPYLRKHVCQRFEFPVRPKSHPERGDFVLGLGKSREAARSDAARKLEA